MKGYLLLIAVAASVTLLGVAGVSCGSHPQLPPADVTFCLMKMNAALDGKISCEAIVKAITDVVSQDQKCSDLLLHGLKCTDGRDGG